MFTEYHLSHKTEVAGTTFCPCLFFLTEWWCGMFKFHTINNLWIDSKNVAKHSIVVELLRNNHDRIFVTICDVKNTQSIQCLRPIIFVNVQALWHDTYEPCCMIENGLKSDGVSGSVEKNQPAMALRRKRWTKYDSGFKAKSEERNPWYHHDFYNFEHIIYQMFSDWIL